MKRYALFLQFWSEFACGNFGCRFDAPMGIRPAARRWVLPAKSREADIEIAERW
jgi:hypothetical protein